MGVNQALNARESGQPVSLQSGTIVVGQSGTFVRLESGENVIIQSGIGVLIASGAPISIQSGTFVNIGSGIGVVAASGLFVITDSGQRVVIQSGAPVSLQSGLPVNIGSGIGVLIQSGISVNIGSGIGVIAASGLFVITDSGQRVVLQSGTQVTLGSGQFINVGQISGNYVQTTASSPLYVTNSQSSPMYLASGAVVIASVTVGSGLYVTMSGQGVISASGLFVITDSGQRVVIQSGASVSFQSGLPVNIGSGIGVLIQSGINVNIGSGIGVVQASGAYIINDSGIRVVIQSGAPVSLQSGLNVVTQSGISIMLNSGISITQSGWYGAGLVIMGMYRAEMSGVATVLASGQLAVPGLSIDGDIRVDLDAGDSSGLRVVIQSGAPVTLQSGTPITVGLVSLSGINIAADGHIGVNVDIVDSSGLRVVIQSGAPVSLQSGLPVNIGSGVGVITSISGQAVFISGTVSILSGSYVNLGSNTVISMGSGIAYQMSGANVIATVSVGSGLGVIVATSGQGFPVVGGQYRPVTPTLASGTNVQLTVDQYGFAMVDVNQVNVAAFSGINTIVTTSGQGFPAIGGQYRPISVTPASGQIVIPDMDNTGILYADINYPANSGFPVNIGSGVGVIATVSGLTSQMISGQALYVQMSGVNAQASGLYVITGLLSGYIGLVSGALVLVSGNTAQVASGQALYVQMSGVNSVMSGIAVVNMPLGAATVNASTFIVNTSAVQLPNTAGREHLLQIMDSGVYWIGGVNTTNSGIGFMWQGIPGTDYRSQLTLRIANLNLLYMKSQTTSGKITIMSMN